MPPDEAIVCPRCGGKFGLALEDADDASLHPGNRIAHYELIELLGEGSFGAVWKAQDTILNRLVALKLPRRSYLCGRNMEGFLREARLAAQVRSPGVVQVYEVGIDRDSVYLACELIEGRSLDKTLMQYRFSATEAARLCLAVVEAVRVAHAAGLVHRDLKPANILVDQAGKPHIADFGLATNSATEMVVTVDGKVLGTPVYMAPEQARGDLAYIDRRSDIYSLGVVLYELLTGRVPFEGDIHILVTKILFDDPVPPRSLHSSVPRDLETICLKCLEKKQGDRYQTAEELATDLKLFIEGKPIHARPVSRLGRLSRWARRKPLLASISAIAVFLLISTVAALGIGQWRTANALDAANHNLYFHGITSAQQKWSANDPAVADTILDQCPAKFRDFEWGYLKHLIRTPVRRLHNAGGVLAYRPDGMEMATSGGADRAVKVWNTQSDTRIQRLFGHQDHLFDIDYHPAGTLVASAGRQDRTVRIWDTTMGREILVLRGHEQPVEHCAFTPDGSQVVSHDLDNIIRTWNVASGEQAGSVHLHLQRVRDLAFSPTRHQLAVASRRGERSELSIYDYTTGDLVTRIPAFDTTIGSLAYSADGNRLAVGELRRSIRVWQIEPTPNLLATIAGPVGEKCRVAFDPAGERVAAEASDGGICVWDVTRGETQLTLRGHFRPVYDIAFSPDGKHLAAGTGNNEVCIWDVTTQQGSIAVAGGDSAVYDLAVCPGGKLLAAAFGDGTVKLLESSSGEVRRVFSGNGQAVWSVAFSPDGERLAVASEDASVRIYSVATGELELHLAEHTRPLRSVVFSPDGSLTASAGLDGTIRVWDSRSGRSIRSFRMRGPSIRSLAFHPDGRRLAGGGAGVDVSVFDVVSGETLWTETGNAPIRVWDLAFSPDGNLLAISRGNGVVGLRNAVDGKLVRRFGDLAEDLPVALAFSPNGRRLATATARTAISLWETSSGRAALRLSNHPATAGAVVFSPDGQALITGGVDGTVRLWPTIDHHAGSLSRH